MLLSPGNKSRDSFSFYLQKSIARWEPSLSLTSSSACFQSTNPTCIALILTNKKDLFSKSNTGEVGISDHHDLVSTMLNKKNSKGNTKTLFYRDCQKLEENKFAKYLTNELQKIKNTL